MDLFSKIPSRWMPLSLKRKSSMDLLRANTAIKQYTSIFGYILSHKKASALATRRLRRVQNPQAWTLVPHDFLRGAIPELRVFSHKNLSNPPSQKISMRADWHVSQTWRHWIWTRMRLVLVPVCCSFRAVGNSTTGVIWRHTQHAIILILYRLPINPSYPRTSSSATSNSYLFLQPGELNSSDL